MIILIAIIVGCFLLGIWQVDRYSQKQRLHDTPSVSPDVEINQLINAQAGDVLIGKNISIDGSFIPDSVFKLDNRMHDSMYGVDIFSLFKERVSGKVYMVNMGWLEVGNKRDRLAEHFDFSGVHALYAKIARIPSRPPFVSHENFQDDKQDDLWMFVNQEYLVKQYGMPIEDLILINMQPANELKYRELTREDNAMMHILYAIQWFVFSLVALFGLIKIYR